MVEAYIGWKNVLNDNVKAVGSHCQRKALPFLGKKVIDVLLIDNWAVFSCPKIIRFTSLNPCFTLQLVFLPTEQGVQLKKKRRKESVGERRDVS
ncbi:hypothetical protein NC653_039325 [Populus alba x Populus x berolinensis]|uniref:Uncharacterized protein n=1 Tax=Populus alba x Populus x berolinensis TaxID=444605 RepID=A0AAD6LAX3_9ROSI|nr:hypothetical protein NC653_039325 [Populus alba x Populus x berolinensis]